MATAISVILAIVMMTTGGVVYAADDAVPGDALYGVDRAVEEMRLRFTTDPERAVALGLDLATERLREAAELSEEGSEDLVEEALNNYGETISGIARTLDTTEGVSQEELESLLAAALSVHEEQLEEVFGPPAEEEEPDSETCVGADPHPVAEGLAERYDASYDEIMTWFCDGYGFGEIMLAFETRQESDLSAEDLLAWKTELGGWGLVWQELSLIGKPEDVPEGPPGGPPQEEPGGPPEEVPGGPPEEVPGGPPEDVPGGPPEDVPVGPPDEVPGDLPDGPPEEGPPGEIPPTEVPSPETPPVEEPPTEMPPEGPPTDGPPSDVLPEAGPPDSR